MKPYKKNLTGKAQTDIMPFAYVSCSPGMHAYTDGAYDQRDVYLISHRYH